MPNLKCQELRCIHNAMSHCSKEMLSVSSSALCRNYIPNNNKSDLEAYEFAHEKAMSIHNDKVHIDCESRNCVNNISGTCSASYIKMDKIKDGVKCLQERKL